MNEPWPGSVFATCATPAGCPLFDAAQLSGFTNRVIAAIRTVDQTSLAFYEPLLTFDFGAQTAHADTGDPHAGFSFHDYCLPGAFGGPTGDACGRSRTSSTRTPIRRHSSTGDALLLTEFGATDDLATIQRIVDDSDAHMVGWQYWHYCGCDDPTTQGATSQAIVNDARPAAHRGQRPRGEARRPLASLPAGRRRHSAELLLRPGDEALPARLLDGACRRQRQLRADRAGAEHGRGTRLTADRGLHPRDPLPERLRRRRPGRRDRLAAWRPHAAADLLPGRDQGLGRREPPGQGSGRPPDCHRRPLARRRPARTRLPASGTTAASCGLRHQKAIAQQHQKRARNGQPPAGALPQPGRRRPSTAAGPRTTRRACERRTRSAAWRPPRRASRRCRARRAPRSSASGAGSRRARR